MKTALIEDPAVGSRPDVFDRAGIDAAVGDRSTAIAPCASTRARRSPFAAASGASSATARRPVAGRAVASSPCGTASTSRRIDSTRAR
jgi:hypothetical protein